jgi:hypothetical protein
VRSLRSPGSVGRWCAALLPHQQGTSKNGKLLTDGFKSPQPTPRGVAHTCIGLVGGRRAPGRSRALVSKGDRQRSSGEFPRHWRFKYGARGCFGGCRNPVNSRSCDIVCCATSRFAVYGVGWQRLLKEKWMLKRRLRAAEC